MADEVYVLLCYVVRCYGLIMSIFMLTSSNGNICRVTGPLCGEFTGPGEFPTQRPVTRSFDVFFDLRLNKRVSKQPSGWWFETLSRSLWRHCNVFMCFCWFWAIIYVTQYHISQPDEYACINPMNLLRTDPNENKPKQNITVCIFHVTYQELTHWGRDKIAAIFQMIFSDALPWKKSFVSLGLVPNRRQAII